MSKILLQDTTQTFKLNLSVVPTTDDIAYDIYYTDYIKGSATRVNSTIVGTLSSTTAATVVTAPASGYTREITQVRVTNPDTVSTEIIFIIDYDDTERELFKRPIVPEATYTWVSEGLTPAAADYTHAALKGDTGAQVVSAAFDGDDIIFTLDDASEVTLADAAITLKGDPGTGITDEATGWLATGGTIPKTLIVDEDCTISGKMNYFALHANGKSLVMSDYAGMKTQLGIPATFGDVVAPATNSANYVPQWDGTPNSKTLVNGLPISANAKSLVASTYDQMLDQLSLSANGKSLVKSDYAGMRTQLNVAYGATANDMASPGAIGDSTPAAITGTTITANTSCNPDAVDGAGLGDATHQWFDLFLAEGGVINWDNGDATLTQTGNNITLAGAELTAEIGTTAPAKMRGWMAEVYKTASAYSPLTALECSKTIVSNYGMTDADCVIDLPTAAEGLSFICILPAVRARYFRLKCPAAQADKIYLLGVAGSDDGYVGVASGYATGASCQMFTFKASDGGFDWFCIPIFGTWVVG